MFTKRPFLISLLLGLVALVIIFYDFSGAQKTAPHSQLQQDDWQITQSQSWQLNRTQPDEQQFLHAAFMRKQQNQIIIQTPQLILQKPGQLIRLDSEHADITDQTLFKFDGNVIINRLSDDSTQNLQLLTESIIYNQDSQTLASSVSVKLLAPNQITTGLGLQMNLNTHQTKLLSEVKTHYVP